MIMTIATPSFIRAADDLDGAADDEPGPSPIALLIAHDAWHGLGDIETVIRRCHETAATFVAPIAGRELSILLTSDEAVAALNAQYRGQDKPTNVLSFPAAGLPDGAAPFCEPAPLGDIVIAYETVMREAGEEGKPPLDHLAHLTVHGLLHLAGFDHETDDEAERMEALEREILALMGLPDPYTLSEDLPVSAGL